MLQGFIDHIQGDTVSGWIWDSDNPDTEIFVEICGPNGQKVTVRANFFRQDLQEAGIGDGRHGFHAWFATSGEFSEEDRKAITARVVGTSIKLRQAQDRLGRLRDRVENLYRSYRSKPDTTRPDGSNAAALQSSRRFDHFAGIATLSGSKITVWTDAPLDEALPIVTIAGKPAWQFPDLFEITGRPGMSTGYTFRVSGMQAGDEIAVSLASGDEIWLAETRIANKSFLERDVMTQMAKAAKVIAQPGAVSIICNDATAPGMDRAHALANILTPHRPAVIFCFVNDSAESDLECSVTSSETVVVAIPWSERVFYFRLARAMGLVFETSWICGPDQRSFLLASQVTTDAAKLILDVSAGQGGDLGGLPSVGLNQLLAGQVPTQTQGQLTFLEFEQAENRALDAPCARDAFALLPVREVLAVPEPEAPPTLLLIWKQQDAGLYGRRVDHIARSYRSLYPDHRVVILEILNNHIDGTYRQPVPGFSEFTHIREMNTRKLLGRMQGRDDTEYRQIYSDKPEFLGARLQEFLLVEQIIPLNSVIILFPNIQDAESALDILSSYPLIVDVVDNQLTWTPGKARLDVLRQYFMMCQCADQLVFNSALNRDRFAETDLIAAHSAPVDVIPNWYQLPAGFSAPSEDRTDPTQEFRLIYTGNMNDRIDWALIADTIELDPRIQLHLVGEARHADPLLTELLSNPRVIYHGPQDEEHSLMLLARSDLAVIPHVVDDVSTFMNPLKSRMYEAIGLPAVAMSVPGLSASKDMIIAETRAAFLQAIRDHLTKGSHRDTTTAVQDQKISDEAHTYGNLINQLRRT